MRLDDVNLSNIHLVSPKQAYEWVKTNQWSQKDFLKWWSACVDQIAGY